MKRNKTIQNIIDCKDVSENCAVFSFHDSNMKFGKVSSLSNSQLTRISLMLKSDLKNYIEKMANQVYPQMKFILICKTINNII